MASSKMIKCPVYGVVALSPVAVAVLDTVEFQRLRYIRQLGLCSLVFPGSNHSRFEHSLGTAHLARRLIERLAQLQPELEITQREILCVELAALCHDLGHGPFSHLWEVFFKRAAEKLDRTRVKWRHEQTSVDLLRHLLDKNDILYKFSDQIGVADVEMIVGMISGKPDGPSPRRRFLYQIVSNKDTGMDVDKWDYFVRDALHLGVKIDIDYERLLLGARVLDHEGEMHLCFRDNCRLDIEQVYATRVALHRKAYRHSKFIILDEMLIDALIELERSGTVDFWNRTEAVAAAAPTSAALDAFVTLTDDALTVALTTRESALYRAMLCRSTSPLRYSFAGKLAAHEDESERFLRYAHSQYQIERTEICLAPVNVKAAKKGRQVLIFSEDDDSIERRLRCIGDDRLQKGMQTACGAESTLVVALKATDPVKLRRLVAAVQSYDESDWTDDNDEANVSSPASNS